MRIITGIAITLLSLTMLSGCQTDGASAGETPSLAGHTPLTSANLPPSDYRHNAMVNASTMVAPR